MKAFERYHPDLDALHGAFRTGPCFVCRIVEKDPDFAAHFVYQDDRFIAFLDKYPRQVGYTLVSPKQHLEQVTAELSIDQYLDLQRLVYDVCEAVRQEVGAERMYIFSFGSNQGNAHVHWHVVPLPPGTPYEDQQGAAVGWRAGVLKIPGQEMAALAARISARIKRQRRDPNGKTTGVS
jgi:diadenosine tetraphosphate (Ap4A) HIT family hydrolase